MYSYMYFNSIPSTNLWPLLLPHLIAIHVHVHVHCTCVQLHVCILRVHVLSYFTQDIRRKVARVVAAKCILAARVDSFHENSEGDVHVGQGRHVNIYM